MNADQLQKHIYATYASTRYGLAAIAVFFPMFLYVGGYFLYGLAPQGSMSAYYFAAPVSGGEPPMRVWFVGLLFALAVLLILYRGFSDRENAVLNLAGMFGIGVAIFPPGGLHLPILPSITVHGLSAILLFVCIGYVSIKCAKETLHLIQDERIRRRYRRKYQMNGSLMLASPLSAFAFTAFVNDQSKYVFFIEALGIWAFAYYWWTKSQELAHSKADLLALQATTPAAGTSAVAVTTP